MNYKESDIPETARSITCHEANMSKMKDQLLEMIKSIDNLYVNIHEDTKEMLQPLIAKLHKKIHPLLHQISWSNMNLPLYIKEIEEIVQ